MTAPVEELPAEEHVKTTAGNYFVGNYPPFSYWNVGSARSTRRRRWHSRRSTATPMGIYVHLPFCRRRCHFCYFRVYTGKDAKPDRVTNYLDAVLKESELYRQTPLLAGRRPRLRLFRRRHAIVPFHRAADAAIHRHASDCFPGTRAKRSTFECGAGHAHRRKAPRPARPGRHAAEHRRGEFRRRDSQEQRPGAPLARKSIAPTSSRAEPAFQQINIDLIAGMLNETEANWRECVRKVIDMAPECVTIYQMEVPFNTTIYKEMHERGRDRRSRGRLAAEAGVGRLRLLRVGEGRLHDHQRLHGDPQPAASTVSCIASTSGAART